MTSSSSILYDDLRGIAHRHLQSERPNHTLSTTALVNEVYLRLSDKAAPKWRGRPQFYALLSRVMRHVLIDYARGRLTSKRGGKESRVPFEDGEVAVVGNLRGGGENEEVDILALSEALEKLEEQSAQLARIVECRFFGGMTNAEIATALGISIRTVERGWPRARAYLYTLLNSSGLDSSGLTSSGETRKS